MELIINNQPIEIQILRKNNKNLYMRFSNENTLTITCNRFVTERKIQKIIQENEKALIKMWEQKRKECENDQYFNYLGKKYTPVYDGKTKNPIFNQEKIWIKDERTLEKFYQAECKRIFTSELERITPYFSDIPSFTLKIRNMKTRWGVNNRGNNTITLNSELLKKDLDLLDYVIIHELCHFYEPNHSPSFWRHVEEFYPKYKEARKRLRG